MPFYNGNAYLNEALEAVSKQKVEPIEVIVCVDKESVQPIIDPQYSVFVRVIYNCYSNSGAGIARFAAIQEARYRYLAFLDCDDLWDVDKMRKQLVYMDSRQLGFCFSGFRNFKGDLIGSDYIPNGNFSISGFLTKRFTIGCLTVVVDRCYFDSFKPISARRRNDYLMWYDILSKFETEGVAWGALNESLASHRIHSDSLTSSPLKSLWGTFLFYRSCNVDVFKSIYYLIFGSVRTAFRRFSMGRFR